MTQPLYPLLCISNDNSIDLVPAEHHFSKVAASALIDPGMSHDTFLFDGNGNQWSYQKVSDKFKNTFWTRLLARTFYNPIVEAKIIWTKVADYRLDELKDKLKDCVDKDDDIITQFEEADVIKSAIDKATVFDDLIKVLNKYVFEVNEEELWNEKESQQKESNGPKNE